MQELPTPQQKLEAAKSKSLYSLIGGTLVVLLAVVGGVAVAMKGGERKEYNRSQMGTQGGNAADVNGLVTIDTPLECVPKGHDYYRTNSTLAVDPTNSDIVYVGVEYKGIYKTSDGGISWVQSDKGIRGYAMESDPTKKCVQELGRIVIDPSDSNHLIASRVESPGDLSTLFTENAGVYESNDAGGTWKQILTSDMNASGSRAIAFDPKDSKVVYYGSNNMKPSFSVGGKQAIDKYFNSKGILYKSTDAGASWTELPTGAEHGFRAVNIAVDPADSKKIWLFTFTASEQEGSQPLDSAQKPVLISTDGGQTWEVATNKLPSGSKVMVDGMLSPTNGMNAFFIPQTMGGNSSDYVTLDGGATWKSSNVYNLAAAYDPNDSSGMRMLGYAPYANAPGIYESKDGGLTWVKYSDLPSEVDNQGQFGVRISNFVWSTSDTNIVYMSGSGGLVWKSVDNGKTWKKVLGLDQIGGKNKNKQGSVESREKE